MTAEPEPRWRRFVFNPNTEERREKVKSVSRFCEEQSSRPPEFAVFLAVETAEGENTGNAFIYLSPVAARCKGDFKSAGFPSSGDSEPPRLDAPGLILLFARDRDEAMGLLK